MSGRNKNEEKETVPIPPSRSTFVSIVNDGALGSGDILEGKVVPVLILDTSDRAEIDELIKVHSVLPPGDHDFTWWLTKKRPYAAVLSLNYVRPVKCKFSILMPVQKYGGLIDMIIDSEVVYLQGGRPGDRLSGTIGAPRIIVGVPRGEEFPRKWEKYLHSSTADMFIKNEGLDRRRARRAARELIKKHRELNRIRMPASI